MIGILIQGQDTYLDQIYDQYKSIDDLIIFSGWSGSKIRFKNTILSNPPSNAGYGNSNLQFRGMYYGAEYAKTLGFSYLLKIRADLLINNIEKLLTLLDTNTISFLAYHNWDGGYYIDYIIGGASDNFIKMFKEDTSNLDLPTEKQILSRLDRSYKIQYILPIMEKNNISCYSLKWNRDIVIDGSKDKLYTYP